MNTLKTVAASALILTVAATAANADLAVGLTDDNTLVMIDSKNPSVTKTMKAGGVDKLLGIDIRPSNKLLYGVGSDGTVVTIDLKTGKATKVSKLEKMIPAGTEAIVDFNPKADKLRFMGTDGTNLRADVTNGKVTTDGSLAFIKEDMHAGEKPAIKAAAYTNSYGKPEKTAMFDIDSTIVALIQQTKPNDGTLKAVGKLGIDGAKSYAFDIQSKADGSNTAWLVADNTLYKVALDSGKATEIGAVSGAKSPIRDITVLPTE